MLMLEFRQLRTGIGRTRRQENDLRGRDQVNDAYLGAVLAHHHSSAGRNVIGGLKASCRCPRAAVAFRRFTEIAFSVGLNGINLLTHVRIDWLETSTQIS